MAGPLVSEQAGLFRQVPRDDGTTLCGIWYSAKLPYGVRSYAILASRHLRV